MLGAVFEVILLSILPKVPKKARPFFVILQNELYLRNDQTFWTSCPALTLVKSNHGQPKARSYDGLLNMYVKSKREIESF